MQVLGSIRQIPTHIQDGWNRVSTISHSTMNWVLKFLQESCDLFTQTEFYERNFKVLDKKDLGVMTGAVSVSGLVSFVALSSLGVAVLPITMGFDTLCILGSWSYSHNGHFKDLAWEEVDRMRRAACEITIKDRQKFPEITSSRGNLNKSMYDFLNEHQHRQKLDKEIEQFRKIVYGPHYEEHLQIVESNLKSLKDCVGENHKALIENLSGEIHKIGRKDQDLEKIERLREQLTQLKLIYPALQQPLNSLSKQMNTLFKSVNKCSSFDEGKTLFIAYLEQLQLTLSPHKKIDKLPLNPPIKNDTIKVKDTDKSQVESNDKKEDQAKEVDHDPNSKIVIKVEEDKQN